jgi:hypothetical protein
MRTLSGGKFREFFPETFALTCDLWSDLSFHRRWNLSFDHWNESKERVYSISHCDFSFLLVSARHYFVKGIPPLK